MARFVVKPSGILGALKAGEVLALEARGEVVDAVRLRATALLLHGEGASKKVARGEAGDVVVTQRGAQAFVKPAEFLARYAPCDAEGEALMRDLGATPVLPAKD